MARGPKKSTRFTATSVAAMPPGTYTDPGQPCLQLRVRQTQKGLKRSWLLHFRFQGQESRILLGHYPHTSLDTARGETRTLREGADKGIDPRKASRRRKPAQALSSLSAAAVGSEHSIENLAHEFMEREVKPNRKRPEYVRAILDRDVLREWKGRDVRTIKARDVSELLDKVVDRGSRTMANRVAATVYQMFNVGLDRGLIEASPARAGLRPGGEERPRDRALSDAELAAFLRDPLACTRQPRLSYVIAVLLTTAARRSELAKAKWSHIDLANKIWLIPAENSKSEKAFTIPLSSLAVETLERLRKRAAGSVWVLPATDASEHLDPKLLTRGVAKCLKRFKAQGVQAFTLHDLRRTARTGLGRLGVAPHIAERCLNHSIGGMIGVYDQADYIDERRAALDKWASHLRGLADAMNSK